MTRFLLDVASYQSGLALSDVKRADFGVVNFKTSHGLGTKSVHPLVAALVTAARALGLGGSTSHYRTAGDGRAQADWAWSRLVALGLASSAGLALGIAHQLD